MRIGGADEVRWSLETLRNRTSSASSPPTAWVKGENLLIRSEVPALERTNVEVVKSRLRALTISNCPKQRVIRVQTDLCNSRVAPGFGAHEKPMGKPFPGFRLLSEGEEANWEVKRKTPHPRLAFSRASIIGESIRIKRVTGSGFDFHVFCLANCPDKDGRISD